ncbi:septum formation initiator family protein [Frigidibacter sp. ROC022]|uniref:septum formation initiator family protein n=1 Tax=Frigidibacter sp. ROC022 TaxID=2971796 RepID=UPI00215B58C7|nr:septum formation initiator family protein [Frigidibacter sp. ROC022]MCR8723267.1 septum formation initiator family protein [Frigidibacter sp. ROC022]
MTRPRTRPSFGSIVYLTLAFTAGAYFAIAGVQGDYGLFRRIQIDAEAQALAAEKAALEAEVAALRNLTKRMSDDYLDLDLLDEQARDILGYVRPDEVVIR